MSGWSGLQTGHTLLEMHDKRELVDCIRDWRELEADGYGHRLSVLQNSQSPS